MPKIEKAERRDKRQKRDRYGMRESGRSVQVIQETIRRKALRLAKKELVEYEDDTE